MKKALCLPLFLCLLSSFSLPQTVNFGDVKRGCMFEHETFWDLGGLAFNGAAELGSICSYLKYTYQIPVAVETGTYWGNTTIFLSHLFEEVHSIEIIAGNLQKVKEKIPSTSNIHFYLGSSDEVLQELLPTLADKPIFFYLDAHWKKHWPLLNELIEIGKTHYDNCIIMIDDFQVPEREDIPFDQYGENSCSYAYIKTTLDQVFSDYSFHYIIPKDPLCKAKFLAIPTNFKKVPL